MTGTYHHPTYDTGDPILIGHHVEITTGQMEGTIGVVTGIEEGWLLLDSDGEVVRTDARCVERYWPPVKLDSIEVPDDLAHRIVGMAANYGDDRWSELINAKPEANVAAAELTTIVAPLLARAMEADR